MVFTSCGIQVYVAFKDQFLDDPETEFEVKEYKPIVFIKKTAERIEIKFSKFIDEFKKFLYFYGCKYNAFKKKISMPKKHLEALIK